MITGAIKSQIDQIWNAFWSGGISNPLEVIEQITYLLFLRRLDDLHTLEENKSARLEEPMARRVFPEGSDGIGKGGGRPYEDLRWSRFKHFAPAEMYTVVSEHVFPFLRTLGGDDSKVAVSCVCSPPRIRARPRGERSMPCGTLVPKSACRTTRAPPAFTQRRGSFTGARGSRLPTSARRT
jgi:hypothetical protein